VKIIASWVPVETALVNREGQSFRKFS
jgi:hypothetical protein